MAVFFFLDRKKYSSTGCSFIARSGKLFFIQPQKILTFALNF